jgi:hypothetical protein
MLLLSSSTTKEKRCEPCHRHLLISLYHHLSQFLQDRVQKPSTGFIEALMNRCITDKDCAGRSNRSQLFSTGFRMRQPAKYQRLYQIGSAEFAFSLNTSSLSSQNTSSFFQRSL